MRVLIGMEQFGHTRQAYRRRGHEAWSCDLMPARDGSPYHLQGDVRRHLKAAPDGQPWDLAIFHPDCTYFTNSAAWAFRDPDYERYPGVGYHQKVKPGTLVGPPRREARERDAALVRELRDSPIRRKAFENPVGYMSAILGPASQTIQPNQFGEDASKATCLWLFELPLLIPTKLVAPRMVNGRPRWANQTDGGQNKLPPSDDRAMQRAATYPGISEAFADQWGYRLDGLQTALDFVPRGSRMTSSKNNPRAGAEPCTIAPKLVTPWATPAARDDASGPNSGFDSRDGGQSFPLNEDPSGQRREPMTADAPDDTPPFLSQKLGAGGE